MWRRYLRKTNQNHITNIPKLYWIGTLWAKTDWYLLSVIDISRTPAIWFRIWTVVTLSGLFENLPPDRLQRAPCSLTASLPPPSRGRCTETDNCCFLRRTISHADNITVLQIAGELRAHYSLKACKYLRVGGNCSKIHGDSQYLSGNAVNHDAFLWCSPKWYSAHVLLPIKYN